MGKDNLTDKCLYYGGEVECPESIAKAGRCYMWEYERDWATQEAHRDENSETALEYIQQGLKDFNTDDRTPITLKALLFNRYCQWNSACGIRDKEDFKDWYLKYYLK